eukprot:403376676
MLQLEVDRRQQIDSSFLTNEKEVALNSHNTTLNLLLSNCSVNYDFLGLYYRFTSKNLKLIRLEDSELEDTGFQKVLSKLQGVQFPQLKEISMSGVQIELLDESSQKQFMGLLSGGKIIRIDVDSNQLQKNFCETIYNASSQNFLSNLTILNLSKNPISDSGAKFIALAIKFTINLRELYLNNCELSVNFLEEIIESVMPLKNIQLLDLSGNNLIKQIVPRKVFSNQKDFMSKKLMIDLSYCDFTDEYIYWVANLIKSNYKIQKINLSYNDGIMNQGMIDLLESLKFNDYLEELDLSNCYILQFYTHIKDVRIKSEFNDLNYK